MTPPGEPLGEPLSEMELRVVDGGAGDTCRRILAALPTWFGIPESVAEYVAAAETNPTVIATVGGVDVGMLTLLVHTNDAAEIAVMGVMPEHHREGIGRAMLARAESWLVEHGVHLVQVKTLSGRHPDSGYAKTRAFYFACGFLALQEFDDLWSADQPALQLVKVLGPR